MKKIATLVFAMMLAASLSFAQDTGGDKTKTGTTKTAASGKKATKAKKGAKKSKKGSGGTTTPAPK